MRAHVMHQLKIFHDEGDAFFCRQDGVRPIAHSDTTRLGWGVSSLAQSAVAGRLDKTCCRVAVGEDDMMPL